jgi:Trk-type K+ transport system membrane component
MRRRLLPILKVLGMVISVFGLSMLLPLGIAEGLRDAARTAYDEAVLATLAIGAVAWLIAARCREELKPRDGYLLVVLIWTLLPIFAALPLLIYLPHLSFTDAYFEAMSGLTTTGATVLSGLDVFTAFSAIVACVNNTGPGLGQVGPSTTYAVLDDFQTWVCTFAMLLGRLELFTLLVVLSPSFWKK